MRNSTYQCYMKTELNLFAPEYVMAQTVAATVEVPLSNSKVKFISIDQPTAITLLALGTHQKRIDR